MNHLNIEIEYSSIKIYLDGRTKPLEVIYNSDSYQFQDIEKLSEFLSEKVHIDKKVIKQQVYRAANREFQKKELMNPDSCSGIVSLLSGKPFIMVDGHKEYPQKYFSQHIELSNQETSSLERIAKLHELENQKIKENMLNKIRLYFQIKKLKRSIAHSEKILKEDYLTIDFSKLSNGPNHYFVAKILDRGRQKNGLNHEYDWFIVDEVTPKKESKPLNFFTIRDLCVANISNIRSEWEQNYDEINFVDPKTETELLKFQFAYPHLKRVEGLNLSKKEKRDFFVGLCLEELTNSYLHAHESYHASGFFKNKIFENELMAYLYQMWDKPSYGTLFYMFNLQNNEKFNVEGKAVRQIIRAYSSFSKKKDLKELVKLPLSDFKEMSRIIYVNIFQDLSLFDYFKDETNPIIFG